MKNILVINSFKKQNKPFLNLFRDLNQEFNFFAWSTDNYFLDKSNNFVLSKLNKKIYLGPNLDKKINFFFFLLMLPAIYPWRFFDLMFTRSLQSIEKIICLGVAEKIIFTPLARLMGIKTIWFVVPQENYEKKSGLLIFLLRLFSKKVKIITFTSFKKDELISLGFRKENINNVSLGIEVGKSSHQDNIFFSLAKAEKSPAFFKNFTIGTVANLNDQGQVENLLRVIKNCLSVVPNLQLVVIGSSSQTKNFSWLARKMEIENNVWFVGEQEYLGKWFDNFDVYLALNKEPVLFDLETILEAMASGLPVLAFFHKNLEDLVINNKTGFLIEPDVNVLSQKVVELGQDKRILRVLRENAKIMVDKYFSRQRQIGEIRKILN